MLRTVLAITGASGAGKSTLENALVRRYGGGRVRTITTRLPRAYETKADYDFVTPAELLQRTGLLWVVAHHGHQYAVARDAFEKAALANEFGLAIICITPKQHELVASAFVGEGVRCIHVHLDHPGDAELTRRLRERGDSLDSIPDRLKGSYEFEKDADRVPNLHRIPVGSPAEVLKQVLGIIESTTGSG